MSQALHVFLTEADRSHLDNLIKKGICSARVQNRARILLLADRGMFGDGKERTRQQISEATLRACVRRSESCMGCGHEHPQALPDRPER